MTITAPEKGRAGESVPTLNPAHTADEGIAAPWLTIRQHRLIAQVVITMASRERNYRAEYERRKALGKSRGLTTAQARRGAKKFAVSQPQEHLSRARTTAAKYGATPRQVTQQRLARRQVRGVGKARMSVQRFHSLNRAMDFAAGLPDRAGIYVVGHGTYRVSGRYKGKLRGWAALNDFWDRERYVSPVRREQLAQKDREIFDPKGTTYEVRWSAE